MIERLNQTPDKHFLAFLDLIGTQIRPPLPARVPLTFTPTVGSQEATLAPIPARTQVAAELAEGETDETRFETERPLGLTTAKLVSVLVRQPQTDRFGDHTQAATGDMAAAFPIFTGDQPIDHSLYLAADTLLTRVGPKRVVLMLQSPQAEVLSALPITWSYWDGSVWQAFTVTSTLTSPTQWEVAIADLPDLTPNSVNNQEASWLRAQFIPNLEQGQLLWPEVTLVQPGGNNIPIRGPFSASHEIRAPLSNW